jgi:eukaryotic-like serine/threonine-protein kinase
METLEDRLRNEGRIPLRDVAHLVRDVLEGLIEIHSDGRVHRDICPATIALTSDCRARLLDRRQRKRPPEGATLDAFDGTLGTFWCMAPEQVRGLAAVDPRADVYGVGAVAFRALTGRMPFEAGNALTLIALKLDRDPPSLSDVTGEVWPPELERFSRCALARDREGRFKSAIETLDVWTRACARWLSVQPS